MATSPIQIERMQALGKAFSPSAPIDTQALFSGRIGQLVDVINAVNQKGQHAILFGERGVGKTSLARVISSMIGNITGAPGVAVSINCDATMDFSSLWHKIVREITLTRSAPALGFVSAPRRNAESLEASMPAKITPDDIRHTFSRLGKCLIVIDELDRLTDSDVTGLLADTIKNLSDHAVDTTLILVGVADSVPEKQLLRTKTVQICRDAFHIVRTKVRVH